MPYGSGKYTFYPKHCKFPEMMKDKRIPTPQPNYFSLFKNINSHLSKAMSSYGIRSTFGSYKRNNPVSLVPVPTGTHTTGRGPLLVSPSHSSTVSASPQLHANSGRCLWSKALRVSSAQWVVFRLGLYIYLIIHLEGIGGSLQLFFVL